MPLLKKSTRRFAITIVDRVTSSTSLPLHKARISQVRTVNLIHKSLRIPESKGRTTHLRIALSLGTMRI